MGAREWNKIAESFNSIMGENYNRTGKQCRQRWMNILDPSIKKDKWQIKEDLILL
jgi:myb proto-oncogene protein